MLDAVAARLVATPSAFRQVGGLAELPAAEEEIRQLPAAFVVPLRERAGENPLGSGGYSQRVAVNFGVVLAVSRAGMNSGRTAGILKPYWREVKDRLLGWAPLEGYEPIEYAGGALFRIGARIVLWQMEFRTAYEERNIG